MAVAVLAFAAVGSAAPSGSSDLRITKTDGPDPVNVGSILTYTIRVQNLGPDTATGVTVTDQLPKGVNFVSATATAGQRARKGKKVTCDLGGLNAPTIDYGGPPTVTISVVPRQVGTISNTASVKGDQKDPVASNNKGHRETTRSLRWPAETWSAREAAMTTSAPAPRPTAPSAERATTASAAAEARTC